MRQGPEDSSWRYRDQERAQRYGRRKERRMAREAALLRQVFEGAVPRGDVLDVPCGTGRIAPLLVTGDARYVGCDAAAGMLAECRDRSLRVVQGRLPELPFADKSFDTVVCFRYLHHVPLAAQARILAELVRLARRQIVVSAFHPRSSHEWQRRLRIAFGQGKRARFPTPPAALAQWMAELGYAPARVLREGVLRDLWLGRYVNEA